MKANAGFTLVEVLVASLIALLVLGAVISIQMMSTRTFAEGSADVLLERTGNLIMERIVRGPSGDGGLREARLSTVSATGGSAPRITFSVDKNNPPTFSTADDTQCAIYLEGAGDARKVMYDPDTTIAGNEVALHPEALVTEMNVTVHPKYVDIELVLERTVQPFDSAMEVRVSTSVRPRCE
jgi:prepilin-type N-terminal cleavage/methylation domain-containing protein